MKYDYCARGWVDCLCGNHLARSLGTFSWKEPACQCSRHKRWGFSPWVGKIPWRRAWQPTPIFLPGESHGQTEEPGGLYSIRLQRVGQDWSNSACTHDRKAGGIWQREIICDNRDFLNRLICVINIKTLFRFLKTVFQIINIIVRDREKNSNVSNSSLDQSSPIFVILWLCFPGKHI